MGEAKMKTSVEIDEKLLAEVRRILGTETLRETIEKSFEEVVQRKALEQSAQWLGKIDLDLTRESIRKQRRKRDASR